MSCLIRIAFFRLVNAEYASVRVELRNIMRQPKLQGSSSICLTEEAYMALARILLTTLDMCEAMRPRDYDTPSAILESGSVFFREDVNGSRTYIEDDLRGHRLWHDQDFWNHSLRVAVHLQVKSGGKIPTDAGAGVSGAGTLIRLSCRVHVFTVLRS